MSSGRITPEEVLAACGTTRLVHEPVTASEVAEELGCSRRTAWDRLEELAERGDIHSKEVGARSRVWWRPADHASATYPGITRGRDGTEDARQTLPAGRGGPLSHATERDHLEAEFGEMFDRISDAFYALDDDWQFTYVNDRAEELIDYRGEGLVGRNIWDVFEWAEESTLGEEYREAMERQEPTSFEFYYPDPLDAWYEMHAYPSETGLSVYFRDVTERREREQALRESEEQLRALIEVLPIAVFVAEDDGQIVEWNEAAEEIWGGEVVESDSVAEYAAYEGWWADTGEPVEPDEWALARALRGEKVTDPDEIEIEGFDGERRTVLNHGMPVRNADGEASRAVVTLIDITERKERERELKRVERQFEAAFNNPSAFMGLLDPDGTVRRINETALEFAGIDEADVRGEKFWETPWFGHSEEIREELRAGVERAADGEYVRSEILHGSPDGDTVVIDAMLEPVHDEDGEVVAIVPSGNDITERKQHEERLERQNDRLESFASMLAHELRNPVTIGQIYSQQLPDETDPEAVEYVTEAFDRIEDMIDVMLMLTRGDEAVGDPSPVELASLARDVWDDVDAPDGTLDIELDRTVQADVTYTRHLFRNLLENAVEHGSTSSRPADDDAVEHGGADVTVTVGELPDGFYVADDGRGIPAEDRDAIFDEGYTTAADSGGTGLGLAFVRKFVDVYGWDCTVTESAAGGARFEFRNIGDK